MILRSNRSSVRKPPCQLLAGAMPWRKVSELLTKLNARMGLELPAWCPVAWDTVQSAACFDAIADVHVTRLLVLRVYDSTFPALCRSQLACFGADVME
jgi:hypothetical protein